MIIPVLDAPSDWSSVHRKTLQDFLESETGRLTLQWLAYEAPELLDGCDVNKTLVASGAVKGYGKALENLFRLTKEQPAEVSAPSRTEYPSLDDDSAWPDSKPSSTPNQ